MVEHRKEVTVELILLELASLAELLKDHLPEGEDWTECETCRQAAADMSEMLLGEL